MKQLLLSLVLILSANAWADICDGPSANKPDYKEYCEGQKRKEKDSKSKNTPMTHPPKECEGDKDSSKECGDALYSYLFSKSKTDKSEKNPTGKSTLNDVSGIYTCYVSSSTKKDKIRGKDNRGRVIIIESEDRTRYPISISIWHDNRDNKVSEKLGASISYPEALGGKNYIGDVFATGDNIILKYELNPFNKTTAIINRFTGFIEIKPEVFGGWGNIIDGLTDEPSVISIKNGHCEKNKRKF